MQNLEDLNILVIGDIMLDKYTIGEVDRISPEAPVPIVNVTNEYNLLGGCGNVVRNIRELGVQVDCLASIGIDKSGQVIKDELKKINVTDRLIYGSKKTTVKERIIADQRKVQMLRIDREEIDQVKDYRIIKALDQLSENCYDIIVVSDYAKGMITEQLMKYLKSYQKTKIIVDPKPVNGFLYDDIFMITPNEKEWMQMQLSSKYNLTNVKFILETKGRKGMTLYDQDQDHKWKIKAEEVNVYNVSGAGDTVIAIMSICISLDFPLLKSAMIANKCAGYVVTQPGTTPISKNIFMNIVKEVIGG